MPGMLSGQLKQWPAQDLKISAIKKIWLNINVNVIFEGFFFPIGPFPINFSPKVVHQIEIVDVLIPISDALYGLEKIDLCFVVRNCG